MRIVAPFDKCALHQYDDEIVARAVSLDDASQMARQCLFTGAQRQLMIEQSASRHELGGLSNALRVHARVVVALMLRDIKTRMGASYFGFAFGLILPLGHVGIVLALYLLTGRRAALGTGAAPYLTTAVLPFIIWSYTHQKVSVAFAQNMPLTAFPIVKIVDILVARSLVEILNSIFIVIIVLATLTIFGEPIFIFNEQLALMSILLGYVFGVSTGYFFAITGQFFSFSMTIGFLLVPLNWMVCGVFFIPEALPDQLRWVVWWFPVAHIVDMTRLAVYPTYISTFSSVGYVVAIILANFLLTMSIDRIGRTRILSS